MSDWDETTLGQVCSFKGGNAFPQDEQGSRTGTAPFIKVSDLSLSGNDSTISRANNWVSETQISTLRLSLFPAGSSVFAKIGEGMKSERVRRLTIPTAIDNNLMAAVPAPTTDPRFLYYLLQTVRLASHAVGSALPYLKQSTLQAVPVVIPKRPEQQAIAEVLGALDDKIAANTALAATAEQMLMAEIDAAWLRSHDRSSTLADFVELNPRVAVPRAESAIYVDMKRLPESGWSIDGFDYREPKGGARFQNGDTLLARITPCLENRKTGFVDHLPDGQVGIGSTEFIVLRARNDVAAPISFLLATATRFRDHAIQQMIGTSGRQRVAASDLASFEMPTPDPAWLADFGGRAVAIFQTVSAQSAENRTLAATRDALLPQLMSGKLRVRDAEVAASEAGV